MGREQRKEPCGTTLEPEPTVEEEQAARLALAQGEGEDTSLGRVRILALWLRKKGITRGDLLGTQSVSQPEPSQQEQDEEPCAWGSRGGF